jgi:hypothetical protein
VANQVTCQCGYVMREDDDSPIASLQPRFTPLEPAGRGGRQSRSSHRPTDPEACAYVPCRPSDTELNPTVSDRWGFSPCWPHQDWPALVLVGAGATRRLLVAYAGRRRRQRLRAWTHAPDGKPRTFRGLSADPRPSLSRFTTRAASWWPVAGVMPLGPGRPPTPRSGPAQVWPAASGAGIRPTCIR